MIQALVALAEKRGYVTYDQIIEALDDDGEDRVALRNILFELEELGIELRNEAENAQPKDAAELIEQEYENRDSLQSRIVADISAIPSDDPVGLYFRQMAQEPLLTAADEIDLAKRIERGFKARGRLDNPDVMQKSDRWRRHLRRLVFDGQCAREHLGRAIRALSSASPSAIWARGCPFGFDPGGQTLA